MRPEFRDEQMSAQRQIPARQKAQLSATAADRVLFSDFHNHATAHLTAGLFEAHDRSQFETTAISLGPDQAGEMRERLKGSV